MKFISSLTPQEIEDRLVAMAKAILTDDVLSNVDALSTNTQVASARLIHTINQAMIDRTEGSTLRSAIDTAADCNVLTDALLSRLNGITDAFHSVNANQAAVDNINTTDMDSGTLILVLDIGDGQASFKYWNGIDAWVDVIPVYTRSSITFGSTAETNRTLYSYDATRIGGAKLTIYSRRHDNHRQTSEVTILHRETVSGHDAVLTDHTSLSTGDDILVNLTPTVNGNTITITGDSVEHLSMITRIKVDHEFEL